MPFTTPLERTSDQQQRIATVPTTISPLLTVLLSKPLKISKLTESLLP